MNGNLEGILKVRIL